MDQGQPQEMRAAAIFPRRFCRVAHEFLFNKPGKVAAAPLKSRDDKEKRGEQIDHDQPADEEAEQKRVVFLITDRPVRQRKKAPENPRQYQRMLL